MQAILQPVTGIYVSNTPAPRGWPHRWRPALASDETAVLKDFVALADSCGVPARTVVRKDALVEDVILNEIDKGKHTLLVLGVNRRTGEDLFFGNGAKSMIGQQKISILLLSS